MTSKIDWNANTKASDFFFAMMKELETGKKISAIDVRGMAFFIGKVKALEG